MTVVSIQCAKNNALLIPKALQAYLASPNKKPQAHIGCAELDGIPVFIGPFDDREECRAMLFALDYYEAPTPDPLEHVMNRLRSKRFRAMFNSRDAAKVAQAFVSAISCNATPPII